MPGLTIPHLVDFGADAEVAGRDLTRPGAWDALRTGTQGPFAMAGDRADLEAVADAHPEAGERMKAVVAALRTEGAESLASYGVGGALPECWLLRLMPDLHLSVTEYGEETVAGLRRLVGDDAQVVRHDLLRDDPLDADVHLFHRIDTEFTNRQWRRIMGRFAHQKISVYTREELRAMPHRRSWTRAGWMRTRGAFERLWRRTHRAEPLALGDLEGWLLRPKG